MRALAYLRVSTDEQRERGHSIDAQRRAVEQYAALHGLDLVGIVLDEGVSAGVPLAKRKGGAELGVRLASGDAVAVIATAIDRLFRDVLDGLAFYRWADDHDVAVHSIRESIDTSSPAGWMQLAMLLVAGEYERRVARVRTKAVSDHLRQQGRVYGPTPYGCVRRGNDLLRCPEAWAVREAIVQLYRAGRTEEGRAYSFRTLSAELVARRIAPPRGGRRWPLDTLANLIRDHDGLSHLAWAEPAVAVPSTD